MCRRRRSPPRISARGSRAFWARETRRMPAFINIGQRLEGVGESEELKAFTTGGFFGTEFGPFNLPFPNDAADAVRPPKGMTAERFEDRQKKFKELLKQSPVGELSTDYHQQSMLRSFENAHRLLSSKERDAFDLTKEPKANFEKYNTGRFGQGCLLARRLTEAGARFIEVTTEYVPFVHWDTHENGHTTVKRLKDEIDRPIAQLILDLEKRGLLERTLVDHRQRIQPGHDDRRHTRQHGDRPIAGQDRQDGKDGPVRPAPPFHRLRIGRHVGRRDEERVSYTAKRLRNARWQSPRTP